MLPQLNTPPPSSPTTTITPISTSFASPFGFNLQRSLLFDSKMMSPARTRYPFTVSQWQELEHQALILKYMIAGMPVPPHLLYTVRRSLDSSLSSSKLMLHHQPQQIGWSCFEMGFGRKIDPEPGRCRRTDGKKWRCSKEAYSDSKYCERHMHRGRNRSRKPVELTNPSTNNTSTITTMSISSPTTSPPSSSHHRSIANGLNSLNSEHNGYGGSGLLHSFLYPPHSSRNLGSDLSSHENSSSTTNYLLDSAPYSHLGKGYGLGMGRKEEVNELPFFSETSGSIRNLSGGTSLHDSWQLSPLTMRSSPLSNNNNMRQQSSSSYSESGQKNHDYFSLNCDVKNDMSLKFMEKDVEPKKVMHHFFDEWPKDNKDCWIDRNDDDKLSRNGGSSKIQLSISMANSSNDLFFARNNGK